MSKPRNAPAKSNTDPTAAKSNTDPTAAKSNTDPAADKSSADPTTDNMLKIAPTGISPISRANWAIALLWTFVVIIISVAVWYGVKSVADNVGKIMAATIAAVATIGAAILTHALTSLRENYTQLLKRKEDNYIKLLDNIGKFIRNPDATRDDFQSIVLYSWVVASPHVVAFTQLFMKTRSIRTLQQLLLAMRRDLGQSDMPKSITLKPGEYFGPLSPPPSPYDLNP